MKNEPSTPSRKAYWSYDEKMEALRKEERCFLFHDFDACKKCDLNDICEMHLFSSIRQTDGSWNLVCTGEDIKKYCVKCGLFSSCVGDKSWKFYKRGMECFLKKEKKVVRDFSAPMEGAPGV